MEKPADRNILVYVRNMRGKALEPTNAGKAARLLKAGKARVACAKPFTIQLLSATGETVRPHALGLDVGYAKVGVSVINKATGNEAFSAEITLLARMKDRIAERAMYRRNRRHNKTRYRAPRFDNRKTEEGTLAPSIQHKLDSHVKIVTKLAGSFVPTGRAVMEAAQFDIQKIKNPDISSVGYQQGDQAGFWNLREYIFHRDSHKCQNPDCKAKGKDVILQVHHIGFWKNDRTDRPDNLITLCTKCHRAQNHSKNGFLFGWEPKLKNFRPETFMSTVYWRLYDEIAKRMPATRTFGYITKSNRIALGLEKTHATDAFVIAGGTIGNRAETFFITQSKRNNRSLSNWRDAKYIDIRTGEAASGSELNCGRRTRNKNKNTENLRKYRGQKLAVGCIRTRTSHYSFRPHDLVFFEGERLQVRGIQNKGEYIKLEGMPKPVRTDRVRPYRYINGLTVA